MRIGIDLDDTLVKTSESFNRVLKKHNVNFKKSYKDDWDSDEIELILDNYALEILKGAEIKEDAKEVLDYLSSCGHELVIITARNNYYDDGVEEFTNDFVRENNLKISKIYFDQSIKSDLAKKINIDLMIDDSIEVYNNMKIENIDCILFGDKIKTWKEVLEYIKEKEE